MEVDESREHSEVSLKSHAGEILAYFINCENLLSLDDGLEDLDGFSDFLFEHL